MWGEDPLVADKSALANVPIVPWAEEVFVLGTTAVDRAIARNKKDSPKASTPGRHERRTLFCNLALGRFKSDRVRSRWDYTWLKKSAI